MNFHDQQGRFPTGGGDWKQGISYTTKDGSAPQGPRLQTASWLYQILPYLEQGNVAVLNDMTANNRESFTNPFPEMIWCVNVDDSLEVARPAAPRSRPITAPPGVRAG